MWVEGGGSLVRRGVVWLEGGSLWEGSLTNGKGARSRRASYTTPSSTD